MTWLIAYFTTGAIVMGLLVLASRIGDRHECDRAPASGIADVLPCQPRHLRLRQDLLPMLGTGAMLIALWPLVLTIIKDSLFCSAPSPPQRAFSVMHADLRERHTVEDIERAERVTDPFGAVPDLAFGHLNTAWQRFKDTMQPGDTLCSFCIHWSTGPDRYELRTGYAVLRGEDISAYFLKSRKRLPRANATGDMVPARDETALGAEGNVVP